MGIAKGNTPGIEKYTAPSISAATQQYALARKSVESMAPGGGRDAALRNLSVQEAGAKNQILSGGYSDALSRLAQLGAGGTSQGFSGLQGAMSGMGGASSIYGQSAEQWNQMASQKGAQAAGGVGTAGSIAGALL
jgi:hypothetical protein